MDKTVDFYTKKHSRITISFRRAWLACKAAKHVKGKKTLSLGCGDGLIDVFYGYMASEFLATDIVIDSTKERFPNLPTARLDVTKDNIPECDVVVMFDVLEHIPADKEVTVLKKIASSAKKILLNIPVGGEKDQPIDRDICVQGLIGLLYSKGFKLKEADNLAMDSVNGGHYLFMVFENE